MTNPSTPPTANNHIDQGQQEGLSEAKPLPVEPIFVRVSDLGPNDAAARPTNRKIAVQ